MINTKNRTIQDTFDINDDLTGFHPSELDSDNINSQPDVIDQNEDYVTEVREPKQKNNIVVFFLSSKEQMKDNFLAFPDALKNNLTEV